MASGEEFDPEKSSQEAGEQKFYGFEEDVSGIHVPAELPILPLRGVVVFPSAIAPLLISRGASLKLVEDALAGDRILGLVAQKNAEDESPGPDGLYSRGTAGRILKMLKYPDSSVRILVQGLRRIEIQRYTRREPYFRRPGPPAERRARAVEGPRGDPGAHGAPVRQVRLDDPLPARRAAGRGDEHQGPGQGHRPDRLEPQHLARGEAGPSRTPSSCAPASRSSARSSIARSSSSSSATRSSRRCRPSSTRTRRSSTSASR